MNNTNVTIHDILSGYRSISISVHVAGGIVIAIVILTCCCTLCVRNKCARIVNKLTGRKRKEKYILPDIEEGRKKRAVTRELRKKRKEAIPSDQLYNGTEVTAPIIPRESEKSEDASPINCYKCYRKKKRGRRTRRQIR